MTSLGSIPALTHQRAESDRATEVAPRHEGAPGPPLVSVVIATKNSASTLRRCLDSVASQTYRPLEVIVVDRFSTDSTVAIAKEYTDRVYSAGPERSSQYNLGFRLAEGNLVYRIDSDFVLEPDVIREAVDRIVEGYEAVVVPNEPDPSVSFWARVRALEGRCYHDDEWHVAARFFQSSVLRSAGGYDESLVAGEDYDLHNRLLQAGCRVGRIASKEIHLGEPKSLREVYGKYYYYGRSIKKFLLKNATRGTRQLLPLRTAYLRHWKDFVRQPDLTVAFPVYQFVKFVAAWRGWASAGTKKPTNIGRRSEQ